MQAINLSTQRTMRALIRRLGTACVAVSILLATVPDTTLAQQTQQKPPMTIVSWGGAYTRSQMLAFVKPYRNLTGQWVNMVDYHGGLKDIRAQVRSSNVKWDLVDLEEQDAVRGCNEGLLEPINHSLLKPAPDGLPAHQDFVEGAFLQCAVGSVISSTVVAYNPEWFPGEKPTTLVDFFNTKQFPGPRGMRREPRGNLEWALLADGVPGNRVYEVLSTAEGVDRAFAVLDRLKKHIVWWDDGSEPPLLLASGKVAMSSAWNGRIYSAVRDRGENLAVIWDGQIWEMNFWAIPKGSEHRDMAFDFLSFATDAPRLADQSTHIAYGLVRRSAMALVEDDVRPHLPTAESNQHNVLRSDPTWWLQHQDAMEARFATWLDQKPWRYNFDNPDRN